MRNPSPGIHDTDPSPGRESPLPRDGAFDDVLDLGAELVRLERECDELRGELLKAQDAMTPRQRAKYLAERERRGGPSP